MAWGLWGSWGTWGAWGGELEAAEEDIGEQYSRGRKIQYEAREIQIPKMRRKTSRMPCGGAGIFNAKHRNIQDDEIQAMRRGRNFQGPEYPG